MESRIQQLITAIEQSEKTEEVKNWMSQISQPEFGLIDSFINTFISLQEQKNNTLQQQNQILTAIRKINEWTYGIVLKQMRQNQKFPFSLKQYIIETPVSKKTGDSYVLLGHIFQSDNFKDIVNKEFIQVMLDDLEYIEDHEVFHQIVDLKVLIEIVIKQVLEQSSDELREKFMDVGIKIIQDPSYKDIQHRREELLDMCQQLSLLCQNQQIIQKGQQMKQILLQNN